MGISFFETMRGEVDDAAGATHPIRFEVKGESTDIKHFLTSGEVKITGVVDGPPYAEQAPLEGEMVISPIRNKEITYDFRFDDPSGITHRLRGSKDISWLSPVDSMTHMEAAISRGGQQVAEGELRFRLSELPEFLSSWWPSSSIPGAEMHTPLGATDGERGFSDRERETLEAVVDAAIVAGQRVPAPDDRTVDEAIRQIRQMPAHAYWLHRIGLRILEQTTLVTDGRRFSTLSTARRQQLLARWSDPEEPDEAIVEIPTVQILVQLLTIAVKMAHFGRADYLDAIGHPRPKDVADEPQERYMRRVIPAEMLGEEMDFKAHAVVIGTGAGGAAVAYQLARKGLAVAMIEEGRYFQRGDFSGPPMERIGAMYRHRATNLSMGTPIVIPQGRTVGGTTTINSGTCFATPDAVLDEWRDELGFPDDFRPDAYHDYTEQVARMLQVEPGDGDALGNIADVIGRGADAMGFEHGPLPRNAPGWTGAGECILGCPEGAKRSTDVSYVPAALRAGAELYTGLPATRVLMDGSEAVAVEARGTDNRGRRRRLRIEADRVIVACGAVHSPIFLRENGIQRDPIGKNLSVHPAIGLMARMDENLEPWDTIPQGYTFEALEEREIRFEGYYLHPQISGPQLPWVGQRLTKWMDEFEKIAQFGFMVRDRGVGSVRRGPDGMPLINYRLSPRSVDRLKEGSSLLAELFFEAGASEVFTGFGDSQVVRSVSEARRLADTDVGPLDFKLLGAHPLGTCRMSDDADRGVVDFDHRVFGTDNLHVVDGSTVPTSLGVNPQMTIMSMALRAGDIIAEQLGI